LAFRQLPKIVTINEVVLKLFLSLIIVFSFTTACGVKINSNPKSMLSANALLERQCASNQVPLSSITLELEKLYIDFQKKSPSIFFNIPEKNYNFKSPLIISSEDLKTNLAQIKFQMSDELYLEDHFNELALEVFYQYQNALRFEGVKCSIQHLSAKKSFDITPYLNINEFCNDKNENDFCSLSTLLNLNLDEAIFLKNNTLLMCQSLTKNKNSCQSNYDTNSINYFQNRFKEEVFNKLFSLQSTHLKFNCSLSENKTTMIIKVFSKNWNTFELTNLTDYVSKVWSSEHFQMQFELTEKKSSDVIEIIASSSLNSYVPIKNNRQIYLSQQLDIFSMKKVLAHEFGHVLGFPDCYTEFYDEEKKSLIYFEISQENTNLMCSLKNGVSVPADYLDQLKQKSCLFK
jgi:hypothetical protein